MAAFWDAGGISFWMNLGEGPKGGLGSNQADGVYGFTMFFSLDLFGHFLLGIKHGKRTAICRCFSCWKYRFGLLGVVFGCFWCVCFSSAIHGVWQVTDLG
jgi:hypothetical protein